MKKLTKQSLDELAKTMSVIPESDLSGIVGAYWGDCFWRCVAYVNSGGSSYSESAAESYAYGYFSSTWGSYTNGYLASFGAGVTLSQMVDYRSSLGSAYNNYAGKIIVFNTNDVNNYSPTNTMHAVILISRNSNGYYVFDPQQSAYLTISETSKVNFW